jgi:transposase
VRHKQSHSEKVQCWGCFAANGMGEFQLFTENLDGPLLKKILSQHLLSSANKLFGDNHWWFLHDNDPKRTSGLVKKWLFNNGIQLIDVPPYSPDCNPIENLWSDLNRRVESRFAHTIDELKQFIAEEWNNTSALLLSKLVASMPNRCKAIVDNHGHKTKY